MGLIIEPSDIPKVKIIVKNLAKKYNLIRVEDMNNSLLEQFEKEVNSFGNDWAELAPSTLRHKANLGYASKQILERTGDLKDYVANYLRLDGDGEIISNPEAPEYDGNQPSNASAKSELNSNRSHTLVSKKFLNGGSKFKEYGKNFGLEIVEEFDKHGINWSVE